ncbi:MAG: ImmA/IrrE family metallo-endopeptidase [Actinomycetota bacterium]
MARRCAELLEEAGASVPVNVRALASLRGATVEEVEQPLSGWIRPMNGRLVIRVCSSDLEARRRFTICHEICHTFFPDFASSPRERAEPDVERFDERDQVEFLCDVGAAELLLPRLAFELLLPQRFTIDSILELAEHFCASIEATARRAAALSKEPVAVVVLERTPTRPQPHDDHASVVSRSLEWQGELCVRWSAGNLVTGMSRSGLVPENSPLARAAHGGAVAYRGATELAPGTFDVQARGLPYERAGQTVDRVIVVLRP